MATCTRWVLAAQIHKKNWTFTPISVRRPHTPSQLLHPIGYLVREHYRHFHAIILFGLRDVARSVGDSVNSEWCHQRAEHCGRYDCFGCYWSSFFCAVTTACIYIMYWMIDGANCRYWIVNTINMAGNFLHIFPLFSAFH